MIPATNYTPNALQVLGASLLAQLVAVQAANPAQYRWGAQDAPAVAAKMVDQVRDGGIRTVSIDGPAWKATLRSLGLKPTYKAIEEFLAGGAVAA